MSSEEPVEDPGFREAVEVGTRNLRTLHLLRNWCAHVRIEKAGGVGLLEEMTGALIGHHFVVCDHATPGGTASWYLEQSALEFHDRNCVGCASRRPVRLPDLSVIVAERDAADIRRTEAEDQAASAAAAELSVRREQRAALRRDLNPVQATIVDQIESLDGGGVEASAEALVATARLAPETFPPPTVEHLFKLLETGQVWAAQAAFDILGILAAEPERLVKCATMFLALGSAEKIAAGVIRDGARWVSLTDVPRILPALIDLACPLNAWMPGRRRAPTPEPFLALHSAHTAAVEAALETNLWVRNDLHKVGSAARGILVLSERDGSTAVRLSRATISRLARGNDIPDRQSGERDILNDLRTAASAALGHDPDGTDEMMTAFQTGASDTGKGRVLSIYRQLLTRQPDDLPVSRAARVLAMQRTLDAVTGDMPSEVQREVEDTFQGHSSYLLDIIGEKSDSLLGAAVLLEGRLREPPKPAAGEANAIERMEAYGRRSGLKHLRDNLVSLVARSAKGKVQSIRAYLAVLAGLPDELDEFRGLMLRYLNVIVTTPETLGLILPTLYSALVGSSSLARGRAAKVVGELSPRQREDAPPLLLEALVALLRDPFVYPISSTVSALRYVKLPDTLEKRAARCLADIIGSGPGNKTQSRLVCDCIRLFAGRYATKEQLAGRAGETLVAILEQQSPNTTRRIFVFFQTLCRACPASGAWS